MKNQNDMIFSIVAGFLAIVAAVVFFFTKPVPLQPSPPVVADVSTPKLPAGQVIMGNGLGGGSGTAAAPAGALGGPSFGTPGKGSMSAGKKAGMAAMGKGL